MLLHSMPLAIGLLLCHTTIEYAADPPVSLELAVEGGFQIDGQQRWMNFLRDFQFTGLRFRGMRASDEPLIENRGNDQSPRYAVTGLLMADNRLALPGLTLRYGQRRELTAWLEKLRGGGPQAITAATGAFGLTAQQLVTLHDALKKPVDHSTKGESLSALVEQVERSMSVPLKVDTSARRAVSSENKVLDELKGLSCGTALAAAVRPYGVLVVPSGQGTRSVGILLTRSAKPADSWPIGMKPKESPLASAPSLFKFLNVEINDRPLSEALQAIQERIDVPLLYDHNALARHEVDLNTNVNFPAKKTFYKRIIDDLLFQGALHSDLRVDEAGKPFLWITSTAK